MENNVARVLKAVLLYEMEDGVKKVADRMNETYDYIWSQTHERVNPSVHVVRAAFEVSENPKLARLLTPERYQLTPITTTPKDVGHYETEIGDLDMAVSTIRRRFRKAMVDNLIDNKEADKIHAALNTLRKEIADVEGALAKHKN